MNKPWKKIIKRKKKADFAKNEQSRQAIIESISDGVSRAICSAIRDTNGEA